MAPRRIYENPDDLYDAVNKYFDNVPLELVTSTGLYLSIGLSRRAFEAYGRREEFEDVIEMARLRVEHAYEVALRTQGGAANIFALKNFGWADKQEQVITGDLGISKIVREIVDVTPRNSPRKIDHKPSSNVTPTSMLQDEECFDDL